MPPTENSLLSALGSKLDQFHEHERETNILAGRNS